MKRSGIIIGVVGMIFALFPVLHARAASETAKPLTRGEVIRIVRKEIQRAFDLRDWHRYAGRIDEYKGADAAALFSLSALDRGTAIGDAKSPVRVIVYADYECPFCKHFETRTAPALHRKFRSRALFVYRFYPLSMHGELARTESIAGACVARLAGPDAFRRFNSTVYAKTGSNGRGTGESLTKLAREAILGGRTVDDPQGLDTLYKRCAQGKNADALIAAHLNFKGVNGTPTIFVANVEQQRAWRVAGSLPAWVFGAMITNVAAGRPGNSDLAVEQYGEKLP